MVSQPLLLANNTTSGDFAAPPQPWIRRPFYFPMPRPSLPTTGEVQRPLLEDSMHARRAAGVRKKAWRKERIDHVDCTVRYEFGRQPASTELSSKKTFCGGNVKLRALKLDRRNYSWGSEVVTRKTHVLEVFYNASYNKLDSSGCCTFQAVISSTLWSHNWSKEED
ncbi:Ribosomal protein S8e family protein [Perilla frutescens var. frutescens]|nr:Ribosomal protein S8e family protein [Perilla frutescens var. frutescens]